VSGLNYYAYSEHKVSAIREVGRLVERLDDLGALQVALKPAPKRVGLYLPLACNAVDWAYPISAMYAFSNLLCAQIDAEPVSSEEVLAGRALQYDALVTWNADWLTQSEADALGRYIARGGKVLLDASSAVEIPGAVRLPLDLAMGAQPSKVDNADPRFASPGQKDYNIPEYVAAVRGALSEYITYEAADPDVVTRAFDGEGVTYLWCANVHTNEEYRYLVERMPVYKRAEDRPVAEEEGREFLKERGAYGGRVETTVSFPAAMVSEGLAVYDLWANTPLPVTTLPDGRGQVSVSMERLGGTLLAFYPSAPGKASVTALPAQVKRGGTSALDIRVYGEDGRLIQGLLPLEVRFLASDGQETYSTTMALRSGRAVMRFAASTNDPPGVWSVQCRCPSTGAVGEVAVEVQ